MRKRKAFTLIELLIVIAIIAVLAVIIVLNLITARKKADFAKAKSEVKTVCDALMIDSTNGKLTNTVSGSETTNFIDLTTYVVTNNHKIPSLAKLPDRPSSSGGWDEDYKVSINTVGNDFEAEIKTPDNQYCSCKNGNIVTDDLCQMQ